MRERVKKDNRGSAIVTVMIVVSFLSVLITVLLYVSAMNYKTKQLEYLNSKSFYITETALEEIKSLLVEDVSKASKAAYETTMLKYASLSYSGRMELYEQTFINEMEALWNARAAGGTNTEALQNCAALTGDTRGCIVSVGAWSSEFVDISGDSIKDAVVKLEQVVVSYTTADGYNTMIQTDFYIEAPGFDWGIDTSGTWTGANVDNQDNVRSKINVEDYVVFRNWTKYGG